MGFARRLVRRIRRLVVGIVLVGLLLPPAQAALLNVVEPPVTFTMLERTWEVWRDTGAVSLPAHSPVGIDTLPHHVLRAAVTSEDGRFLEHAGFDRRGIERAWKHYRERRPGGRLIGGSTISQQVARNVFLCQDRSWVRKAAEAWYTIWLELLVPKKRILEVYLNVAETGPMVFGVEAGAQHWFGKPASALTEREAALLIALLPAPRSRTPEGEGVQRKADWILNEPDPLPADPWAAP